MALDDRYIDLRHFTEVKNSDGTSENKPYSHVVISDKEPTDTSVLWLDTTDSVDAETLDNATIDAIYKSINRLTNRVNAVEERFTHGINLGGFSNNVKTIVAKSKNEIETQVPDSVVTELEPIITEEWNRSAKVIQEYGLRSGWYTIKTTLTTTTEYKDSNGTLTGAKEILTEIQEEQFADADDLQYPHNIKETKTLENIRVFVKRPSEDVLEFQSLWDKLLERYNTSNIIDRKLIITDSQSETIVKNCKSYDDETKKATYSEDSKESIHNDRQLQYILTLNDPSYTFFEFAETISADTNLPASHKIIVKSTESNKFKKQIDAVYAVKEIQTHGYITKTVDNLIDFDYFIVEPNSTMPENVWEYIGESLNYDLKSYTETVSFYEKSFKENSNDEYISNNYIEKTNYEIYNGDISVIEYNGETFPTGTRDTTYTNIDYYLNDSDIEFDTKTTVSSYSEYFNSAVTPKKWVSAGLEGFKVSTNITTQLEDLTTSSDTNTTHLIIKMGRMTELNKIINSNNKTEFPFVPGELLYTYDNNGLYTIHPKTNKLVKLNTGNSGGSADLSKVNYINFKTPLGKLQSYKESTYSNYPNNLKTQDYRLKYSTDGKLLTYKYNANPPPVTNNLFLQKLYINSIYCGGTKSDSYSYNYCDYNFVELSNLTENDITLDGICLQYYDVNGTTNQKWKMLPLEGTIKAKSTFLIRGAKCSVSEANTTVINVPEPDMIWYDPETQQPIKFKVAKEDIDDNNTDITGISFLLISNNNVQLSDGVLPQDLYAKVGKDNVCMNGYIDMVGFGATIFFEGKSITSFFADSSKRLFIKYFSMDNVSQATKDIGSRNNNKDWKYIDLTNVDEYGKNKVGIDVKKYTPQPSSAGKNLFYDKSTISAFEPEIITTTMGYYATDGFAERKEDEEEPTKLTHASRCITWVSQNYYDEYLYYKKSSAKYYICVESFKEYTEEEYNPVPDKYKFPEYYRQRFYTTNNIPCTTHKVVLNGLTAKSNYTGEIYQYFISRKHIKENAEYKDFTKEDYLSEIRTFRIQHNNVINNDGFSFIHITDQQGFNKDEYEVWRHAANYIRKKEVKSDSNTFAVWNEYCGDSLEGEYNDGTILGEPNFSFTLNTGDMTQNGSRLNEWADYFIGGEHLFKNIEQVAVIGNNDLIGKDWQGFENIGNGSADRYKINNINFNLFYTFDYRDTDDMSDVGKYRPVLKANDETATDGITLPSDVYITSLYAFKFGKYKFVGLNSEISENTIKLCYINSSGNIEPAFLAKIVKRIQNWCINEFSEKDVNLIAFCHEMPFTIITQSLIDEYAEKENSDIRNGARINVVGDITTKYWASRLFELAGVKLVLGGHKHTYSVSYHIRENYNFEIAKNSSLGTDTYTGETIYTDKIITAYTGEAGNNYTANSLHLNLSKIQASRNLLKNIWNAIIPTKEYYSMKPYIQMPKTKDGRWIVENINTPINTDKNYEPLDFPIFSYEYIGEYDGEYDNFNSYTAPVYTMLQATGYKHTSNKELPAKNISWLRYYFPAIYDEENLSITVNSSQKYPFYIRWDCTNNSIIGYSYKISEIFESEVKNNISISTGTYNINTDNVASINDITFYKGNGEYTSATGTITEVYANETDWSDRDKIIIKF